MRCVRLARLACPIYTITLSISAGSRDQSFHDCLHGRADGIVVLGTLNPSGVPLPDPRWAVVAVAEPSVSLMSSYGTRTRQRDDRIPCHCELVGPVQCAVLAASRVFTGLLGLVLWICHLSGRVLLVIGSLSPALCSPNRAAPHAAFGRRLFSICVL